MYNFDTMAVHHAFQQVVQDNQGVDGDVPVVVPAGFSGNSSCNDIAWTSAYPQITNMLHHYCKCSRSLCVFFRSLKEAAAQTAIRGSSTATGTRSSPTRRTSSATQRRHPAVARAWRSATSSR